MRAFITVAHTQNLTQAAERLFLSQPAVSAQIKAIESDVGTPLFIRTSNGMQLTRAGEVLLPEAEANPIRNATAALAAGTDDFAAKRMDRNIQRALTGQRVEDIA